MSLIGKIDKAVCLTLDKRYDYFPKIKVMGDKVGIDIEAFIVGNGGYFFTYSHFDENKLPKRFHGGINYPTWYQRPNALNAWKSHKKIIKKAIEENVQHLLLLEDDIVFEEDFESILHKVDPFFEENEWDMIYFGWYSHDHLKEVNEKHVYKMEGGGGFHGVLINRDIMQLISTFAPLGPIDWMCGQYLHNKFNCYAIYPSIISQKSGFSYVEGSNLEKPDRWSK